jgi:hypothetical protein
VQSLTSVIRVRGPNVLYRLHLFSLNGLPGGIAILGWCAAVGLLGLGGVRGDEPGDYLRHVKPLLAEKCFACHGALKQEGGLRLDTAQLAREGGWSGPAVVPQAADRSELIERVTSTDEDLRMPLEAGPLSDHEVRLLRAWIERGAEGPEDEQPEQDPADHWAFQGPTRPAVPTLDQFPDHAGWIRNPIDAFVAAEQQRRGLTPHAPADKRTLLRRVYLDLIGLPPTLEQLETFLADPADDAYERVVEQLLKSPQYAERWGRHWMDIWRYSDWWGLGAEVRNSQKHIWHWRDWIIDSLRDDVGYDEMVRQMLAADEWYPDDLEKLRATGYLARQYFKFNRTTWLDETIEHTSKAFLGLTMNCSKCHDHKYDPFTHEDYYRFRAFFEPYQVRTEQIPGELDYERNGIPRAFDGNLDAPTYLLVRGDEKQPRTSEPLVPGLPNLLLRGEELAIRPVELPPSAHQPGLRPWVLENHLARAASEVAAARQRLEEARQRVEQLVFDSTDSPSPPTGEQGEDTSESDSTETERMPSLWAEDSFSDRRDDLWTVESGDWRYEEGRLWQQQLDGQQHRLTWKGRVPDAFEARVRFTIEGGQMWRSVGLAFDADGEREILVYLSAHAGGPKVQIAHKQQGQYQYPPGAMKPRKVELGESQDLVIRARGELVNVEVNGEHLLAWRAPLPRLEAGHLGLVTFDATAAFSAFSLRTLPAEAVLAEPPTAAPGPDAPLTFQQAQAAQAYAEKALAAAELQAPTLEARAAADRARYLGGDDDEARRLAREAAQAERILATAAAAAEVARLEFEQLRAADDKRAEIENQLLAARQKLEQAEQARGEATDQYTSLRGANKTVESTVETEENRLKPFPATSTGRRMALSQWMTSPDNPLTARVAVNHIWSRHFQQPLVPTVFDFGRKGTPPTHPELLDWLAVELMENQWSMRHLHRLMVTSATYRLSSSNAGAEQQHPLDPENRWYWRMNPNRMEAQVVRDTLLHLSGEMDLTIGGPSVHPVTDEQSRRRSLYFVHSHNDHHRFLEVFDDAGVQECYRREQSIVPQQALALANSRQAFEAAQAVTARLERQGVVEDAPFIDAVFLTLLANVPTEVERRACLEALAAWRDLEGPADRAPPDPARRARVNLVHALLNHNDFITIR